MIFSEYRISHETESHWYPLYARTKLIVVIILYIMVAACKLPSRKALNFGEIYFFVHSSESRSGSVGQAVNVQLQILRRVASSSSASILSASILLAEDRAYRYVSVLSSSWLSLSLPGLIWVQFYVCVCSGQCAQMIFDFRKKKKSFFKIFMFYSFTWDHCTGEKCSKS